MNNICKRLLLLKQTGFCTPYSLTTPFSGRKYKNNLKKNTFYNSHMYNVYEIFYHKIPWFYQDFKNENLFFFLNLYSAHSARILNLSLEIMLSPPKWSMKHLYNSKSFSFMQEQVLYFKFLEGNSSMFLRYASWL